MDHSGFENADKDLDVKSSEHLETLQEERKNSLLCTNSGQINI